MAIMHLPDYVRKENAKLKLSNFRDVDALVFAQLSYLGYHPYRNGSKLEFAAAKAKEAASVSHLKEENEDLLRCVAKSLRYQHIKVVKHVAETKLLFELQFSATTFIVNHRFIVIAFRGTDDTINGWKEDFNMVFLDEIPAQSKAVDYVKTIAKKYRFARIIITGHSKGGNLAFYAAMKQSRSVKKRIVSVYNLDGPDFRENITATADYIDLLPKVNKIVPEESIIGMILQTNNYYHIVKSDGSLFAQHKMYNWHIDSETSDLVHEVTLSKSSKKIKNSLYAWLYSFNVRDRQIIIDNFFDMLQASECTTLSEFSDNLSANIKAMYGEYKESDSETKKLIRKTFIELGKYLMSNYFTREKNLDKKVKKFDLKHKVKEGE
ncbi:MAG: Mbeg1-like protein [Bacilli bacterium]|jgi:pimeloyl-ACP methyl ester carboxylesterase